MSQPIEGYEVRAFHQFVTETHELAGRRLDEPLVKAAVGVVIRNPFAGAGYQEDLSELITRSRCVGIELGRRVSELLGGRKVEGYGKGGVAGINGEQEHVVACVTTVFGDGFRDAVGGGKAWISSFTKVDAAGTTID